MNSGRRGSEASVDERVAASDKALNDFDEVGIDDWINRSSPLSKGTRKHERIKSRFEGVRVSGPQRTNKSSKK